MSLILLIAGFLFSFTLTFDDPCVQPVNVIVMQHIEDLWEGTPHGTIAGYYWAPTATIYLETNGRDPIWLTLLHELAHHYDYQGECLQ